MAARSARDVGGTPDWSMAGRARRDVAVLVDASDRLRDLRLLSKIQGAQASLPPFNPLPPTLDDRLGGVFTKSRKSMLTPHAPDRIRSEWYPVSRPPIHEFNVGQNSRHVGRDPVVLH